MSKLTNLVEVSGTYGDIPQVKFNGEAPEGLEIEVLIEGDGQEVKVGDNIEVNYHGLIYGTEEVFDSSFLRGQSISFPIGVGSLIKAWDQTIPGHKVGTRLLITADPQFAYGPQTASMFGKADANLTFIVDVISVK